MAKKVNKLEKAVDAIVTRLEKAEEFALEQAPEVCKEVVREKLVLGIFHSGISLTLTIAAARLSLYLISCMEGRNSFDYGMGAGLIGGVALVGAIFTTAGLSELISLKTAPKLTILRELRDLTKKDSE